MLLVTSVSIKGLPLYFVKDHRGYFLHDNLLATGPVATVLKNTRVDEKRRAVARRAKSACSAVDTRPTLPSSRRGGGCTSHSPSGMVLSQ